MNTPKSVWSLIFRKKRSWRQHIVFSIVVIFLTAPLTLYVLNRYEIGIDPQNNQCLPPYRIYLVDKMDKSIVKGKIYAFHSELMQPYGKGLKIVDGIAGDTVSVDPEETAINGSMVGEGLALAAESGHTEQELTCSGVVPNGRLWMMGRTRYSFDSRYWGSLDESQIIGRAYPLW